MLGAWDSALANSAATGRTIAGATSTTAVLSDAAAKACRKGPAATAREARGISGLRASCCFTA